MEDSTLLKISLACSIIGIIVLFFISSRIEINEIDLSNLNNVEIGNDVKIIGKIVKIKQFEKLTIIDLKKECTVPILLFDNISLDVGQEIQVNGKLDEYKGKKEIIAEKILKI
jgi:hypothetical protein